MSAYVTVYRTGIQRAVCSLAVDRQVGYSNLLLICGIAVACDRADHGRAGFGFCVDCTAVNSNIFEGERKNRRGCGIALCDTSDCSRTSLCTNNVNLDILHSQILDNCVLDRTEQTDKLISGTFRIDCHVADGFVIAIKCTSERMCGITNGCPIHASQVDIICQFDSFIVKAILVNIRSRAINDISESQKVAYIAYTVFRAFFRGCIPRIIRLDILRQNRY